MRVLWKDVSAPKGHSPVAKGYNNRTSTICSLKILPVISTQEPSKGYLDVVMNLYPMLMGARG